MNRFLDVSTSFVASSIRQWHGLSGSKSTKMPEKHLELYDREACPRCRLVREALTELNLDALIYPVPEEGYRFTDQLESLAGNQRVPFLHDPNTGKKYTGVNDIVQYLYQEYLGKSAPKYLFESKRTLVESRLASLIRKSAGKKAKNSTPAEKPLTLYSFESSPYSRLVRENLCELEIPYYLVNLSKQQLADMGPSHLRLTLGKYKPLPNTKRSEFFKQHGNVQVPYLIDPNTGKEMFESDDIVTYLQATYETA